MRKYDKHDQRLLAIWAADCAKSVLSFFEKACPEDDRPRQAIKACRTWVRTGVFKMADVRRASLAAHAAAREAKENGGACFAARAAGQAVATAHVPQHAFGAATYALKAVAAAYPAKAQVKISKELHRQSRALPKNLRQEWLDWQTQRLPKFFYCNRCGRLAAARHRSAESQGIRPPRPYSLRSPGTCSDNSALCSIISP